MPWTRQARDECEGVLMQGLEWMKAREILGDAHGGSILKLHPECVKCSETCGEMLLAKVICQVAKLKYRLTLCS